MPSPPPAVTPSLPTPQDATPPADKNQYLFTLSGQANYAFDTDLHDGGSFSVFRSGGGLAAVTPFSDGNALRLALDGEYNHYFFRNFTAIPGDDGSDALDAYQIDFRPVFTHQAGDWSYYAGLSLTASGQAQANFGDTLTYGVFGGATYKVSPTVSVGFGLSVATQLEDDPIVFPLLTLDWEITPQLSLRTNGPGVKLAYAFNDRLSAFASASYQFRQFRFDSRQIVAEGVLTDQSVPVTLGVTYAVDDRLSITGEAGVVAYRRLQITEANGHDLSADEADPAFFLSVQAEYKF